MSLNNPWIRIRVSRFTRNLHPEDHKPGLPPIGSLEAEYNYETFLVRQNQKGEWVGQGTANVWLVSYESKLKTAAQHFLDNPDCEVLSFPFQDYLNGGFGAHHINREDVQHLLNTATDANTTKAEKTEVPPKKGAARK